MATRLVSLRLVSLLLLSWNPVSSVSEESSPSNILSDQRLTERIERIVASKLEQRVAEAVNTITLQMSDKETELEEALRTIQRNENASSILIKTLQAELTLRNEQLQQLEQKVLRLENQQSPGSSGDSDNGDLWQTQQNLTRIEQEIQQCKDSIMNLQGYSNNGNRNSADVDYQVREERDKHSDIFKESNSTILKLLAKRSCFGWKLNGFTASGDYWIDPDGLDYGEPPIKVYCDMVTGFTFVHHDKEEEQSVGACAGAGCYNTSITYRGSFAQIVALITLSEACQQHTMFKCKETPLQKDGEALSWWVDRDNNPHYYWAASNYDDHTCGCGLSDSCVSPQYKCNCDSGIRGVELSDNGYISNISALPITQLFLGGIQSEQNQKLTYQIGPLRCHGQRTTSYVATCQDLWSEGTTKSGYYILGSGESLKISYCDMTTQQSSSDDIYLNSLLTSLSQNKNATNSRMQELDAKVDQLESIVNYTSTSNVVFNAISTERKTVTHTYIDFDSVQINVGNAYSSSTGIFTAPTAGMYYFYTQIRKNDGSESGVSINKNGGSMAYAYNGDTDYKDNINVAVILSLAVGDEVGVYLRYGNADIHDKKGTLFLGFLLNMETKPLL